MPQRHPVTRWVKIVTLLLIVVLVVGGLGFALFSVLSLFCECIKMQVGAGFCGTPEQRATCKLLEETWRTLVHLLYLSLVRPVGFVLESLATLWHLLAPVAVDMACG